MIPIRYLTLITATIAIAVAAIALPHAASAGGTCHEGNGVSDATGTTVTMTNNCFVATVLRVDPGATVTFINKDAALHTVTGVAYTWGDDKALAEGARRELTFDESGVYVYTCLLHPGMAGAIVVGDGSGPGPASAVSDVGGSGAAAAGGTGSESEPSSAAAAAPAPGEGGAHTAIIIGAVAAGVALLLAIAGGSMALARSSASRRASAR